jgi:hypothetical protein
LTTLTPKTYKAYLTTEIMHFPPIRVMGLDLAAVNSGCCVIEARPLGEYPFIQVECLYEAAIQCRGDFVQKASLARSLANRVHFGEEEVGLHLVAIEDYARRVGGTNTTAYEHAELGGLAKTSIHYTGVPMLIVPPTSMRSFVGAAPRSGKDVMMDKAKEIWDFTASSTRKPERSNICDAFIHAVIGTLVILAKFDILEAGQLQPHEDRIIFGAGSIVGLIDREGIMYNEDRLEIY